jgi:signal transduction histidine kinase
MRVRFKLNDVMEPYINLSLVFVAAGLALLATIAYLARLVRRHRRSLGALLKLAQISPDPLQLPDAAWPTLVEGGIDRLYFAGNWFGQPVTGAFGETNTHGKPFTFDITAHDDIHLRFELCSKARHGEARLFAENLAGVFHLLMETAVHGKMQALSAALTEQARLSLYLQHDLRNLAQWVEWVAADFAVARSDADLLGTAHHLHTSAHHAAARARRILDATTHALSPPLPEAIALAGAIHQAAEHAGVSVSLNTDARAVLRRDLLDRALDNLFTNAAPQLRTHPGHMIAVSILPEAGKVRIGITMPLLEKTSLPEKLFEPFSSGRPGGLGLGLYQARKSIKEAGGEMTAELCGDNICFCLILPGVECGMLNKVI